MDTFYKVSCYVCLNMQPSTLFNQICKMQAKKKAEIELLFFCVMFRSFKICDCIVLYLYGVNPNCILCNLQLKSMAKTIHPPIHPSSSWQ